MCIRDRCGGGSARGVKLVQRVERQKLDSGFRVDFFTRYALKDGVHDSIRASVPVMIRVFEKRATMIQQRVINAPRIDTDAVDRRNRKAAESAFHLRPQALDIPAEGTVQLEGLIREAADLGHIQNAGSEPPKNRPPTLCAEIERQKVSAHRVVATTIFCLAKERDATLRSYGVKSWQCGSRR